MFRSMESTFLKYISLAKNQLHIQPSMPTVVERFTMHKAYFILTKHFQVSKEVNIF